MTFETKTDRRKLCASLGAFALGTIAGAAARADDIDIPEPQFDQPLRFRLPSGGLFRPRRITLVDDQSAWHGRLPRVMTYVGLDRLNVSGAPLAGELFGPEPAAAAVTKERAFGVVTRYEDELVVDLRRAPMRVADLLRRPTAFLSIWKTNRVIELETRIEAREVAPPPPGIDLGERIGFAYLQGGARDGRLVISPPRDALFGW